MKRYEAEMKRCDHNLESIAREVQKVIDNKVVDNKTIDNKAVDASFTSSHMSNSTISPDKWQVLAVVGPTGVGKSSLADALAKTNNGEIVSADSMQVYKYMNIGTAKVPVQDRSVEYHCIDMVEPGEPYSASLFQRDARAAIDNILSRGKLPIVCGGTGLYVRAALDNMNFPAGEQTGNSVREHYTQLANEHGANYVHELLRKRDPQSAALIHPNNVRRVVRAFEMLEEGKHYSQQVRGMKQFEPFYKTFYVGLTMETSNLYALINARVDAMIDAGLEDEVKMLREKGFDGWLTSSQAIGYKELVDYLDGRCTLDEAIEHIKMSTRRYSKRQRTWFRRDPRINWFSVDA